MIWLSMACDGGAVFKIINYSGFKPFPEFEF